MAPPADRRLRAMSPIGDIDPLEAAAKAWGILAEACDEALAVPGLDGDDVRYLRDVRRSASNIAGRSPVRAVPDGQGAA
jgi:hypothetical protein